jgi:hypothetical protein
MTDEQLIKLASQYLHCDEDGDRACEWRGAHYELLKFAKAMYDKGRDDEAELHVDENY